MMSTTAIELPQLSADELEIFADNLDLDRAAYLFEEYGCLVVRGLNTAYIDDIAEQIEAKAKESIALLDRAIKTEEGWTTPNGTMFLPAPAGYKREQQIMVLGITYRNSATFFRAAFDSKTVAVVKAILGPNVELFTNGQCLYKEPAGGHPKNLHQDGAYFEHKYVGPVAVLNYVVDTGLENGCLHVVPGSHKLGMLEHIDTFSHLGLDPNEWPWERSLPICGKAGDSIFFHVKTIHGSKANHSDAARPVFINRYRRIDDFVIKAGTTAENRGTQAEVKGPEQHGLMVSGIRPYDGE